MKTSDVQRHVRTVLAQVVELAQPQRVILFGSAAAGSASSDSDLDFLVIVPDGRDISEVTDRLNLGVRVRPMPCDFVVVTPTILKKHRHAPGLIYAGILERGLEIYAD